MRFLSEFFTHYLIILTIYKGKYASIVTEAKWLSLDNLIGKIREASDKYNVKKIFLISLVISAPFMGVLIAESVIWSSPSNPHIGITRSIEIDGDPQPPRLIIASTIFGSRFFSGGPVRVVQVRLEELNEVLVWCVSVDRGGLWSGTGVAVWWSVRTGMIVKTRWGGFHIST